MSYKKQTETLKEVFNRAKKALRHVSGKLLDLKLLGEIENALICVGKEKIFELADEVYPYLYDPFSEFRAEAVRTLGWNSRLGINEFCEKQAYQIWINDPDEEVKIAALAAWANYYSGTKNPDVLKKLYDIIVSEKYSTEIRAWALETFVLVSDSEKYPSERMEILELGDLEDFEEFNKSVDWERVNCIMKDYVPGWKEKK